ncbi:hypothetical protein BD626DRAFT_573569 [Schizophyllum amplum]|uniref:Uncharacterized protein n=1 Tax=Schizophyllum amplum TaxID=97359 RepID=A0A550C0M0_9AGAR|nr:hypothetical protein BD626DRAFT_573569 [Auriculariopsis ampla]
MFSFGRSRQTFVFLDVSGGETLAPITADALDFAQQHGASIVEEPSDADAASRTVVVSTIADQGAGRAHDDAVENVPSSSAQPPPRPSSGLSVPLEHGPPKNNAYLVSFGYVSLTQDYPAEAFIRSLRDRLRVFIWDPSVPFNKNYLQLDSAGWRGFTLDNAVPFYVPMSRIIPSIMTQRAPVGDGAIGPRPIVCGDLVVNLMTDLSPLDLAYTTMGTTVTLEIGKKYSFSDLYPYEPTDLPTVASPAVLPSPPSSPTLATGAEAADDTAGESPAGESPAVSSSSPSSSALSAGATAARNATVDLPAVLPSSPSSPALQAGVLAPPSSPTSSTPSQPGTAAPSSQTLVETEWSDEDYDSDGSTSDGESPAPRYNWKAGQRLRQPDGTWGPIIRGLVRRSPVYTEESSSPECEDVGHGAGDLPDLESSDDEEFPVHPVPLLATRRSVGDVSSSSSDSDMPIVIDNAPSTSSTSVGEHDMPVPVIYVTSDSDSDGDTNANAPVPVPESDDIEFLRVVYYVSSDSEDNDDQVQALPVAGPSHVLLPAPPLPLSWPDVPFAFGQREGRAPVAPARVNARPEYLSSDEEAWDEEEVALMVDDSHGLGSEDEAGADIEEDDNDDQGDGMTSLEYASSDSEGDVVL